MALRRDLRGRGFGSGLALLLAACGPAGPGPAGEPLEEYRAPIVEVVDGETRLHNAGAAERLLLYEELPARGASLLFLEGRATTPTRGGGSAWADMEGARVVLFDEDGVVDRVLAGRPERGPPLARPAFVAIDGHALLAVEIDGSALRFVEGEPVGWSDAPAPGPVVGGGDRPLAAARSVFDIRLVPLAEDAPLFWRAPEGAALAPVGRARRAEQAMLAPLVNSGWVAPARDGSVVFASAVRPELRRHHPDGTLAWVATWARPGVVEPSFGIDAGTLVPRFRLIHQAVVEGPDGRIYTLVTSGGEGPADRLLVFEPDGRLLRSGVVPAGAAVYASRAGYVYVTPASEALARTETSVRAAPFEPFVLPELGGGGEVRLEEHRGKVVVVNFWASWCAPCRQEMPLLDALAGELDPARAVVIGLNEDVAPDDGLRFLESIGGVGYLVAEGRGRLRARYGYRGLPYTVVVDPEGRAVRSFYGFGTTIDPIRDAVRTVLGERGPDLRRAVGGADTAAVTAPPLPDRLQPREE